MILTATWGTEFYHRLLGSNDHRIGPAWDDVVAYGKKVRILPQVVAKLISPTDVLATDLYDELQDDDSMTVSPNELERHYIHHNRAILTFNRYGKFVQHFDDLANQWNMHNATVASSSDRGSVLNHQSYRELVRLGRDVIPLIMERYAKDRNGLWHKLLDEIVKGSGSDGDDGPSCDRTSYEDWKKYYEGDAS